jgi:predicted nucleic-acid-binding protein
MMIGLDTNLLIRYLTRDDPRQFAKVRQEIDRAVTQDERLLINSAVLCEVSWVLETAYDYSRVEIADALEQILETAQFEIERRDEARLALGDFRSTKAGFADALIGRINRALGAPHTATFDRDLKGLETFKLL